MSEIGNIQHSTFNAERLLNSSCTTNSMLSVACRALNVFPYNGGGLS
jgi:hypothetical protein